MRIGIDAVRPDDLTDEVIGKTQADRRFARVDAWPASLPLSGLASLLTPA